MAEYTFKEESMEVGDYRAFFDSKVLRVWHLDGREKTFTIEKVNRLTSTNMKNETKRQPLVRFKGISLPFALNRTNSETVGQLYGPNPKNWIGKRITLYPTTTDVAGKTKDCIRIKNRVPPEPQRGQKPEPDPVPETPPDETPANPDDDGR